MREHLKNYFNLSKTEKRGVLVLSSFLLILIFFIWLKPFQKHSSTLEVDEDYKAQIALFYQADSLKEVEFKSRYKQNNYSKKTYSTKQKLKKETPTTSITPFDINSAEVETFKQIKGIGEVLSNRIIQYREKLGGFYSINQLKEVYGIDTTIIEKNRTIFLLNSSQTLKKIDINNSQFKEMLKHPYLEYIDVKKIFKLKDSLKTLSLQDLKLILTEKKFNQISPYLK